LLRRDALDAEWDAYAGLLGLHQRGGDQPLYRVRIMYRALSF